MVRILLLLWHRAEDLNYSLTKCGSLLTLQGIGEVFRCIICIQTGSWPERGTERDAEETEKVLMRTSQQGNKEDVI